MTLSYEGRRPRLFAMMLNYDANKQLFVFSPGPWLYAVNFPNAWLKLSSWPYPGYVRTKMFLK